MSEQNHQRVNKIKKDTAVSRFFQQRTNIEPLIPLCINNKNKRDNKINKLYRNRIVSSDDVSRKIKPVSNNKFQFNSKTLSKQKNNNENHSDFLDKLKKKFEMDHLKEYEPKNLHHRKVSSKPKTLFNDESLKLMNNFKEYVKEKEKIDRDNMNVEYPILNNTISFSGATNNKNYQGTMYNSNKKIQSNGSFSDFSFNLPERDLIGINSIAEIPREPIFYSSQLLNTEENNFQQFEICHDAMGLRSINKLKMPDSGIVTTTDMNSTDHSDKTNHCPNSSTIFSSYYQNN